jgi:tRNA G18 (ribose-2'-O)-methylase SpoU
MRGYFAIGVERLSKPVNAGNLFRSAHAFGASFVFTVAGAYDERASSDTSRMARHLPLFSYPSVAEMALPPDCTLVGIELLDDAEELPSFRHPRRAAYVLGPERGTLSPEMLLRCERVVKIPSSFCVNVATAGAIVMYDRLLTFGKFGERPVAPRARASPPDGHVHGDALIRGAKPDRG